MSKSATSINIKLLDSLAQIILSLTEEERQILAQKIQYPILSDEEIKRYKKALQDDINRGIEQLKIGDYIEYDDSSLPSLLETIKMRGQKRLNRG
jgi:hypothetical protein